MVSSLILNVVVCESPKTIQTGMKGIDPDK